MTWWGKRVRGSRTRVEGRRAAKIALWSTVAGLIFGAIEFGEPLEDGLRWTRDIVRRHDASGDVVVVAIDDRSLAAVGAWPWPRRYHARLIEQLQQQGAKRIFFDLEFKSASSPVEDADFALALARSKRPVTIAVFGTTPDLGKPRGMSMPISAVMQSAELAGINVRYGLFGLLRKLPYSVEADHQTYPSFAAKLAGIAAPAAGWFKVDFAIDSRSVPTISAIDVLSGNARAASVAGRDVLIGTTSFATGDLHAMPGYERMPGVFVHALGADTLRAGRPRDWGWLPAFVVAIAVMLRALRAARLRKSLWITAVGGGGVLLTPLALDWYQQSIDVAPALFLLVVVATTLVRTSVRKSLHDRGRVNAMSGLLNLDALRHDEGGGGQIMVAARIHNYPAIASTLSPDDEAALIVQVARRLTLGRPEQTLYQGDEGIFAWFADGDSVEAVGEHLDALHGFFRNPADLGDRQIDLAISFGVDGERDRSSANRLGSALVACDDAARDGLRWAAHDPATLTDTSWRLSLLGQLDRAIDSGDFWVAYQPVLDLVTGNLTGAEALARWTHPVKGAISPVDFIQAAEQNDRIEKLTAFVLDRAIADAAAINAAGIAFTVSVNWSTRLIGEPRFVDLVQALLDRHGLPAHRLTLEVTETAAIAGGEDKLHTLEALRALGVLISIDDYGTGLSTLEYLKKIPATEIKIDQSFVAAVTKSHSDRLMVQSTIGLVHSLGQTVVAEGVEDYATLDALQAMGCDFAQGYLISRPLRFDALVDMLGRTHVKRSKIHG